MTETKHPEITVQLFGQDGNAFNILGLCHQAMHATSCRKVRLTSL